MKTAPFSPGEKVRLVDGAKIWTVAKCNLNTGTFDKRELWDVIFTDGKSGPAEIFVRVTKLDEVLK